VALSSAAGLLAVGWLATTPWLVDHWPRVLALALFLFVFVVPGLFVPARSAASLTGVEDPAVRGRLEDDRLKLQNDVRIGLLQAVAGVAVIAAVVVTWQQLETDRRQLRQQLDVRLGGIYGLERIAARAAGAPVSAAAGAYVAPPAPGEPPSVWWGAEDRAQVFEILSAYVRTTWHRPPVGPATATALQVRQPDVHAAVSVLARRTELAGDPPLDAAPAPAWSRAASGQASRPATLAAARWARAMTDSIGLTPLAVGNSDASATNSPSTSWVWWSGPTAEVAGSAPMRHEPIWW
jgi:hypothetical protein